MATGESLNFQTNSDSIDSTRMDDLTEYVSKYDTSSRTPELADSVSKTIQSTPLELSDSHHYWNTQHKTMGNTNTDGQIILTNNRDSITDTKLSGIPRTKLSGTPNTLLSGISIAINLNPVSSSQYVNTYSASASTDNNIQYTDISSLDIVYVVNNTLILKTADSTKNSDGPLRTHLGEY